jgi:hypothetical protein
MNVAQINLSFDAEQDRLLFRMSGSDGSQMRAWLTRRLVKMLWPNLLEIYGRSIALQAPAASTEAQHMIADLRREEQLRTADFSQPFRAESASFPLGEAPLLVARVDLTALAGNQVRVGLKTLQGAGVDVNMNEALFHGFCKLLQQACASAQWDMELRFPQNEQSGPRILN